MHSAWARMGIGPDATPHGMGWGYWPGSSVLRLHRGGGRRATISTARASMAPGPAPGSDAPVGTSSHCRRLGSEGRRCAERRACGRVSGYVPGSSGWRRGRWWPRSWRCWPGWCGLLASGKRVLWVPGWLAIAVVVVAVAAVSAAGRSGTPLPGLTASPLPSAVARLRTTGVRVCVRHPIYTWLLLGGRLTRVWVWLGLLVVRRQIGGRWNQRSVSKSGGRPVGPSSMSSAWSPITSAAWRR